MSVAVSSVIGAECVIWTLNIRGVIVEFDSEFMFYTVLSGADEWFIPIWMVEIT